MPTILIVEDEAPIADLLREVLADEGYDVLQARNGHDALAILERCTSDLVLSDVMMPGMDGRALSRAMQAHSQYRSIPLVMMSAATNALAAEDYTYAAFFPKPFNLIQVLDTLEQILC